MTRAEAKRIAESNEFTRKELHEILSTALELKPESFWAKQNRCNKSMDNGFYFNFVVRLVDYQEGVNDNDVVNHMIAFRVLHIFGEYCKIQPKKEVKRNIDITMSEKPKL